MDDGTIYMISGADLQEMVELRVLLWQKVFGVRIWIRGSSTQSHFNARTWNSSLSVLLSPRMTYLKGNGSIGKGFHKSFRKSFGFITAPSPFQLKWKSTATKREDSKIDRNFCRP